MKKLLIASLMLLLSLSLVLFGACAGDSDKHNYSSTWSYDGTHHYKSCTDSGCAEVKDKAMHDIKDGSCSICGYNNSVTVTASEDNYRTVLKSLNEGDIVGLTDGQYGAFTLENVKNVTFIGLGEDVIFSDNVYINLGNENITFKNITFKGGVTNKTGFEINSAIDGLTIKDCIFKRYSQIRGMSKNENVKNIVIEDCTFTDIQDGEDELVSAINVYLVENFTLKNCSFDNVEYNAVQIGNYGITGKIIVTGNEFVNIGDRILYFVSVTNITESVISGNYFENNSDCVKSDGQYIKVSTGETGCIVVGQNTWAEIPGRNETAFCGIDKDYIVYDRTEQLTVEE